MFYVTYDDTTGAIIQFGFGEPVPGLPWIEVDGLEGLSQCRVNLTTLTVEPKEEMVLSYPTLPVPADGVTEAVISGLPVGTRCSFSVSKVSAYVEVTDGTLEIAIFDPQVVRVRLWHPLYQYTGSVEVTFE